MFFLGPAEPRNIFLAPEPFPYATDKPRMRCSNLPRYYPALKSDSRDPDRLCCLASAVGFLTHIYTCIIFCLTCQSPCERIFAGTGRRKSWAAETSEVERKKSQRKRKLSRRAGRQDRHRNTNLPRHHHRHRKPMKGRESELKKRRPGWHRGERCNMKSLIVLPLALDAPPEHAQRRAL